MPPLPAPQNLIVTYDQVRSLFVLTWDAVPGASEYRVMHYSRSDPYNFITKTVPQPNVPEYYLQQLQVDDYIFCITARDATGYPGHMSFPCILTATKISIAAKMANSPAAQPAPSSLLPAPTNLKASVTNQNTICLTWDPVPGAVEYKVEDCKTGRVVRTTATYYITTALSAVYSVRAVDSNGNAGSTAYAPTSQSGTTSPPSGSASGATSAPPGPPPLPAPTNLGAILHCVLGGQDYVELTWDPVPGASHYEVDDSSSLAIFPVKTSTTSHSFSAPPPGPPTKYVQYAVRAVAHSGSVGPWATIVYQNNYQNNPNKATFAKAALAAAAPLLAAPISGTYAVPIDKCECGAYKATAAGRGQVGHSSWCPWK